MNPVFRREFRKILFCEGRCKVCVGSSGVEAKMEEVDMHTINKGSPKLCREIKYIVKVEQSSKTWRGWRRRRNKDRRVFWTGRHAHSIVCLLCCVMQQIKTSVELCFILNYWRKAFSYDCEYELAATVQPVQSFNNLPLTCKHAHFTFPKRSKNLHQRPVLSKLDSQIRPLRRYISNFLCFNSN